MKKLFLSFSIAAVVLIVTTSQKSAPKTKSNTAVSDTTSVISFKDIQSFNAFLKQAASYDQYTKLSPEATLTELWQWKLKQLSDTAKPKK